MTTRGSAAYGEKPFKTVSVTDYGAVGDGTTDDTTAVQAALTAGGRIYAPAGTYLCSSLTVGSNTEIYGDGPGLTIFKLKNTTNASLFLVTAKSFVTFKNFKISGNSANQSAGNGIYVTGASTDITCENVLIDDYYDWGFNFTQGTRFRLNGCGATNGKAGANANATRGGYLFGTSVPNSADDVEAVNCYASGSNNFTDGFMSEYGNDHRIIGCRTAVKYTGFKIKGDNCIVQGCYATGGVQGYQTQRGSHNLVFNGNIAYRCNDSGFYITNSDTVNPLIGLVLNGNMAVECGQSPSSTSYGFAFDVAASATVDQVVLTGNLAIDNQGVATQTRGISFGTSGTVSNVMSSGNICKGNTVDINLGTSLQLTTYTAGWNPTVNTANGYPASVQRLAFWTDNLPQSSGTVVLSDGFGGRGYMVPRAGYIRSIACKSNASVTAGNATFQLRVNGSIDSSFNTQLNTGAATFKLTEVAMRSHTLAAGDMITVIVTGDGSLLPNGTADMDVVVEIAY